MLRLPAQAKGAHMQNGTAVEQNMLTWPPPLIRTLPHVWTASAYTTPLGIRQAAGVHPANRCSERRAELAARTSATSFEANAFCARKLWLPRLAQMFQIVWGCQPAHSGVRCLSFLKYQFRCASEVANAVARLCMLIIGKLSFLAFTGASRQLTPSAA